MRFEKSKGFRGTVRVPGDKSISHRVLLIAALTPGSSRLLGLSPAHDVAATKGCLQQLGLLLEESPGLTRVMGRTLAHWRESSGALHCDNSGTTMRLLAGVLAGSSFSTTLVGDASLSRRPMQRIVEPLVLMGGKLQATGQGGRPPLMITGSKLRAVDYQTPIASAQVKSALLLAGLHADGVTRIREKHPTRDHTERMLRAFGAQLSFSSGYAEIAGGQVLAPQTLAVPGDISSAAFFLVLAAATPGAELVVENVGLNPSRTGILDVLAAMGARFTIKPRHTEPEPTGDVHIYGGTLRGFSVSGADIPRVIDELPILAVAASVATGKTVVRDAAELRVKESDRISALLTELSRMGAKCEEYPDGFAIEGGRLSGAIVDSHGDHRLAMALAVAGCCAEGATYLRGVECVAVSYPGFFSALKRLLGGTEGEHA